jgi:hypothetical protein
MSSDIVTYLNSNEFVEHPMGNYAFYGLNLFGCNSVIRRNNEIMKFYALQVGTNNAIYIGTNGKEIIINTLDKYENITRMIAKNELFNFAK